MSKSLRLGHIVYGDLTQHSGNAVYQRWLLRGLSKLGHTVDVIALPERDYGRLLLDNFAPGLRRRLKKAHFDILLQDEKNHPSFFRLNRNLRGYPIVCLAQGLRLGEAGWSRHEAALYTRVERDYFKTVAGAVVKSRETGQKIDRLMGYSMPGVVAPPGRDHLEVDLRADDVRRRAAETGPLRILFLADVVPLRGLHYLLAGLARVAKPAVRLDVVGDLQEAPSYVREIQATIVREGLTQVVTLWGKLRSSALVERLRRAQVLANPAPMQGVSTAYVEALAFSLPVLASTRGSAMELLSHGRDAFLVDHEDPREIARAVNQWYCDRELLSKMSEHAHERFLRQPTWVEVAERVANFLEECRQNHIP